MGRCHENIFTYFFEGSYFSVFSPRKIQLLAIYEVVTSEQALQNREQSFSLLQMNFSLFLSHYYLFLKEEFKKFKTVPEN